MLKAEEVKVELVPPPTPQPEAREVWLLLEYCNKGTLRVSFSAAYQMQSTPVLDA